MQLFSIEELEGTTIKKECVPFQFPVSLPQDLFLLFCAKYLIEETVLPSATPESNTEQSQKFQMALSPFRNSIKRKRRTGKGCKELTQSKNGAEAGEMVAPLKATHFQRINCHLQPGFVLHDASPAITSVTRGCLSGVPKGSVLGHTLPQI